VLLSTDASEAQGFFYEGGDDHALMQFRDGDDMAVDGIPWDVIGDAMGAREQLELRRSARVRDLHDEEFESDKEDEQEEPDSDDEVIAFEDDEDDMDVVAANNYIDEE
jgi:hypothetical protein